MTEGVRTCPRCLLRSDSQLEVLRFFWPAREFELEVPPGRPCSFCADVERYLDRDALRAEREAFLADATGPLFLAYSGGKDSTAALYHLRRELDVPVVAVLFDNGFIPAAVIDYARGVCAELGAELIVDAGDGGPRRRLRRGFARRLRVAFRGPHNDVCAICGKTFMRRFRQIMAARGADSIALGNNFWVHSPHTSPPGVGPDRMTATHRATHPDGRTVRRIHLTFAASITHRRIQAILDEIGFHDAGFTGYTTNCVLSDFQDHTRERDGQRTDWSREYLSLEVSAGYIEREDALALLDRRPAWDEELMARVGAAVAEGRALSTP